MLTDKRRETVRLHLRYFKRITSLIDLKYLVSSMITQ